MKNWLIGLLCACVFSPVFSQKTAASADDKIIFMCPPCGFHCDTIRFDSGGICQHCNMRLVAGFPEMIGKSGRGHFQNARGKRVAVLLTNGSEIIDFAPEMEIFGQAGMRVFTVAERDTVIRTAFGLRVLPDFTIENAPDADILLLPGGHIEDENPCVVAWIKKMHERTATTFTVCNGAFYLAAAGLLDGQSATTFNGVLDQLQAAAPKAKIVRDQRFVDNGKIVTSAGLASGIDAAFHILGEYEGVGRAQEVATFLEYNWDSKGKFVRAQLADRHVRPLDDALAPVMLSTKKYAGDRSRWTLEVEVTDELISIEKIMQLLEFQLKSGTAWKKTKSSKTGSQWSLTEPNGEQWSLDLRFERGTGRHLVLVNLRKILK